MSGANDRQVGGSHYAAELQHWDLIENHGIGYLEGCASKYVSRWRKKNGLQDLEKGLHYTEKLIEIAVSGGRFPRGEVPPSVIEKFTTANGLEVVEHLTLVSLLRWRRPTDLNQALNGFHLLIDQAKKTSNDSASALRTTSNVAASGDGEPAGLDLSKEGCCRCGDEGRAPEGSGDRS